MQRFGFVSCGEIDQEIENATPENTTKTHNYVWKQFTVFCEHRNYKLSADISNEKVADILKDWAFNMKRADGKEYKESTVKTIWNISAKLLQKKFHEEFEREINPFKDVIFENARKARAAKRKKLQAIPDRKKESSAALNEKEITRIILSFDENTPDGLQKKFYQICAVELAWRGNEAAFCLIDYFKKEFDNYGQSTGRIEYNPIFSKTSQGGEQRTTDSKWLAPNKEFPNKCPVRLLEKLLSKRTPNITTNRLFLTPNIDWQKTGKWFKNCPIGLNTLSKWTRTAAESIGIDTKKRKITNHSNRSSAVSILSHSGANLQEITKITGHSSSESLKPYLKLTAEHHRKIIEKMRNIPNPSTSSVTNSTNTNTTNNAENNNTSNMYYNNCTFNININQ